MSQEGISGRGVVEAEDAKATPSAVSPYRRRTMLIAVSLITMLWLLLQLYAGLERRNDTWPVVGFGMFSDSPSEHVTPQLIGRSNDGTAFMIGAEDFGLSGTQWARYVVRNLALNDGTVHASAEERLERIADTWVENGGQPLSELRLSQRVIRLDGVGQTEIRDVAQWSREP